MEQVKRTPDKVDQNISEYQNRADILKKQIAELKMHFESEIKRCEDSRMEDLYISSAKTLEEMERMLKESEEGVVSQGDEDRVWRENAYVFLV